MIDRRTFLSQVAGYAAAASLVSSQTASAQDKLGKLLPTRPLGRTGEKITAFTLGGAHVERAENEVMSQQIIETAIELGCRSFDNARKYGDGNAEILFGKYLTPKYREQVYIGTKSQGRTRTAARADLELSLKSMRLDYLDLWQIHSIRSEEDTDILWNNGVIEEYLKAREEGLVRHIGFTGHRSYRGQLRLLDHLKNAGIQMDTCLMPINLVDPHYDSYIINVLPRLVEENYAIFAMKTFAHGRLIGVDRYGHPIPAGERDPVITDTDITLEQMHHFVYSLPICSLTSGCVFEREVKENIRNLTGFKGMSAAERDSLLAQTTPFTGKKYEYYKA